MVGADGTRIAFGRFELAPRRRELLVDGRPVPIGGRAFDILLALVEAEGAVVSKEELLARAWPGAIVEENNLHVQISSLRKALGPGGERLIANVARRGYRFVGERGGPASLAGPVAALAPPGRTSLAVLPFHNLGIAPEEDYFAEGMSEELTTALSRFGWLLVIASSSSLAYRERAVDPLQAGRELGARYLVLGSVRRAGGRVRVVARLVEAATRGQIWAESFEAAAADLFELQDQLCASIVGAVEPRLRRAEALRARAKPTGSLDAYDHYLRALWHLFPRTEANYAEALAQLAAAVRLDADFALALALTAHCHHTRCVQGWSGCIRSDEAAAVRLAEAALARAPDDPEVVTHAANALAFYGRGLEASIQLLARALELNPNYAFAWFVDGWLHLHAGRPEEAIARFARALRLSPLDPMTGSNATAATAQAHLLSGRTAEAIAWARRAVRESPDYAYPHRVLVTALALDGKREAAVAALAQLLHLEPGLTIEAYRRRVPLRDSPALRQMAAGLRLVGLPEG
ncbi:MAG: winged helix-turn-helix domain-containing protein [Geminicoccaceae bacterium]